MFRQNVLRSLVLRWCGQELHLSLQASSPTLGLYYPPPPKAYGKGSDSSGQGHWASPFFSPGSLCVSGTRRGAPSGGGRLGSSLDFPRLNGCGGRA